MDNGHHLECFIFDFLTTNFHTKTHLALCYKCQSKLTKVIDHFFMKLVLSRNEMDKMFSYDNPWFSAAYCHHVTSDHGTNDHTAQGHNTGHSGHVILPRFKHPKPNNPANPLTLLVICFVTEFS